MINACILDEHIKNKYDKLQYINKSLNYKELFEYSSRMEELKNNVQL